MKKRFFISLIGILLTWTIASNAYGQIANDVATLRVESSPEKIIPESKQFNSGKARGYIYRNEISTKAVRNFVKNYGDVTDAEWIISPEGLNIVSFTNMEIETRIIYAKSGDRLSMIRRYYEKELPPEVRHLVKSTYYDFNIFYVSEIIWNDKLAYIISMDDKNPNDKISYKIIKVVGSEMEEMMNFQNK